MDASAAVELLSLFPRTLLKGQLPQGLLKRLHTHCDQLLQHPERSPDASSKLAGQLAQQRELAMDLPLVAELCSSVLLPGCERWIRHVIDQQPPQGRGPWTPGRYGLQMLNVWLNVQRQGDYNPIHTHGGSFSGVIFLQVPPQISGAGFDGQLCFHGPEEWHIQSFRTGMAHYVLPVPGDYYVFPAWQPHSVMPFRGEGERWSLAFNVVAGPQSPRPSPASAPSIRIGDAGGRQQPPANISLSTSRPRPGGF
ncbi:MAG: putative 2OG-Fe(II) oxygenase [Cyanobium sp.]